MLLVRPGSEMVLTLFFHLAPCRARTPKDAAARTEEVRRR